MKKALLSLFTWMLSQMVFGQRINDLTGINAHAHKDPIWAQKRFSWVREWHDWSSDIGLSTDPSHLTDCLSTDNDSVDWHLSWNPSYNAGGYPLSFDNYYQQLRASSNVVTVMKGNAPLFRGYTQYENCSNGFLYEQNPYCTKQDGSYNLSSDRWIPSLSEFPSAADQQNIPRTFEQHALWLSLFAAKFGHSKYTQRSVASFFRSEEVIGKRSVGFMEDNNEPNKSWVFPDADFATGNTIWYFSPQQYASMFSADYDGHQKTIEAGNDTDGKFKVGVKNAATGTQLIQAGTTGLNGQYYKDMREHFITLRGATDIPPITANFHHYCTTATQSHINQQDPKDNSIFLATEFGHLWDYYVGSNTDGVHPEQDMLREKLGWTQENLGFQPEGGYWLSEFGYDSFDGANQSGVDVPLNINNGDAEKTQAQWLVRGVLETAASGVVNRMMLYELKDDPSRGLTTYARSGLITGDDAKKRAWYYIMTLKHVLGEYLFGEDITLNSDFMIKTNPDSKNVRVYRFTRPGSFGQVYAIWSPTAANVEFTLDLSFPLGAQLDNPMLHRITEFSEFGTRESWDFVGNTVKAIPVSETPVFLIINSGLTESPAVPVLSNFNCESAGCGSVKLNWQTNAHTRAVKIFYKEINDCNTDCGVFNYQDLTASAIDAGVARHSIIITGLKNGKSYCFYAIPVGLSGNTALENEVNVASCCTQITPQDCLLEIQPSEIAFDPSIPTVTQGMFMESVKSLLSMDGANNLCSQLDETSPFCTDPNNNAAINEGWGHWQDPSPSINNPNTFEINFASPKKLNAMYYQDWLGAGFIKIEYKSCDCPNVWRTLRLLTLNGGSVCDEGKVPVLKSLPLSVHATALRLTRLSGEATIRRLFFCGDDAACPNTTRPVTEASDFHADEIRTDQALLKWNAAAVGWDIGEPEFFEKYLLRISENLLENGELTDPISEIEVWADPSEPEAAFRLQGLAPATTYHADLILTPLPNPCGWIAFPNNPPISRTTFTTEGAASSPRSKPVLSPKKLPNDLKSRIIPNPTDGGFEVSVEGDDQLESWVLMSATGKILKTRAKINASFDVVSIKDLPEGFYWLKIRTQAGKVFTNKIVKSEGGK